MDVDILKKDFDDLKRRVAPLLEEFEAHARRRDAMDRGAPALDGSKEDHEERRHESRRLLEAGDFAKAGELIGLDRAHGGDEADESYERRVRAELHGAAAADAVKPRPEDGSDVDEHDEDGDVDQQQHGQHDKGSQDNHQQL